MGVGYSRKEGIRLLGKLGFRLLLSLGVRDFDLGPQCEYNELRTLGLTSTSEDHLKRRYPAVDMRVSPPDADDLVAVSARRTGGGNRTRRNERTRRNSDPILTVTHAPTDR